MMIPSPRKEGELPRICMQCKILEVTTKRFCSYSFVVFATAAFGQNKRSFLSLVLVTESLQILVTKCFPERHGQSRVLDQVGRRHRLASRDPNDPGLQHAAKEMALQCWHGLTRKNRPQKMKNLYTVREVRCV